MHHPSLMTFISKDRDPDLGSQRVALMQIVQIYLGNEEELLSTNGMWILDGNVSVNS